MQSAHASAGNAKETASHSSNERGGKRRKAQPRAVKQSLATNSKEAPMSTRKERMALLKEKLKNKPLYWVEVPIPYDPTVAGSNPKDDHYMQGIRCADHLEGVRKGRKVAVYQLTNYLYFRKCEHPGCTYGVSHSELP